RARWTFDLVAVAEEEMKFLERFNEQKIYREPDRSAPVGVAAKQAGARLRRLVIDPVLHAIRLERIGMIPVKTRQRPDAVGRKKLIFIQHVVQHPCQAPPAYQG